MDGLVSKPILSTSPGFPDKDLDHIGVFLESNEQNISVVVGVEEWWASRDRVQCQVLCMGVMGVVGGHLMESNGGLL